MTPKEAIEILQSQLHLDCKADLAIKELRARIVAIEALEKQIPKKVKKEILTSNAFTQWRKYNCPNCGCFLYSGASKPFSAQSHCHQCGQALDWGDDE